MIQSYFPHNLFLGVDRLKRIRVYPLPPEEIIYSSIGEFHVWYGAKTCDQCPFSVETSNSYGATIDCGYHRPEHMLPYSFRSLVIQLGLYSDFPCKLFIESSKKDKYGNLSYKEGCVTHCGGSVPNLGQCNIISGGATGTLDCQGYEFLKNNLFESPKEAQFYEFWLRMNAGNETPALIPQVYIDPLQQCRPDFTLFIPKRESKFDWYVIEIDSPTYHINEQEEKKRDEFIKQQGYDVIHVPTTAKMIDKVRKIYSELILENISYIEQLLR